MPVPYPQKGDEKMSEGLEKELRRMAETSKLARETLLVTDELKLMAQDMNRRHVSGEAIYIAMLGGVIAMEKNYRARGMTDEKFAQMRDIAEEVSNA